MALLDLPRSLSEETLKATLKMLNRMERDGVIGRYADARVGMNKERRMRLASLPFAEKLKMLEKLRDRNRAIAASGLRKVKARRTVEKPGDGRDSAE